MNGVRTIREAIGEITHYKNQELFRQNLGAV